MPRTYDVIIVGAGPGGIFFALEYLSRGGKGEKILLLDKGKDLPARRCPSREKRHRCLNCNPCSTTTGWGGSGAFSDGKLTLTPAVGGMMEEYIGRSNLEELIGYADKVYQKFGAPPEVYGQDREEEIAGIRKKAVLADLELVDAPIRHLGTGRTAQILARMKEHLQEGGVEISLQTEVKELLVREGRVGGVVTKEGSVLEADCVVAAPGREGAEWLAREAERLHLETAINPVDIGIRVEVPAPVMQHLTDVVYEAKFIFYSRLFDDKVRTFCMNPYGEVVMENNDGLLTVNGHTHAEQKTVNTNFALLVSKTFTEPFREPIAYGRYVASLANLLGEGVLVQRLGDLTSGRRSTPERISKGLVNPTLHEATPGDLSLVFPYRHLVSLVEMLEALDKVAPGVFSRHTLLYGVEVKFYSSRLCLSGSLETRIPGFYAVGDGAGVSRGLAQASVSGVWAARHVLSER